MRPTIVDRVAEENIEVITIGSDEEDEEILTIDDDEGISDLQSMEDLVMRALENPQEWLMNGQTGTIEEC